MKKTLRSSLSLAQARTGYQTPKLDTRSAVFHDGKILLVQEANGRWALPGGWVDYDQTIRTNCQNSWLMEKATGNRSKCALKHLRKKTGS